MAIKAETHRLGGLGKPAIPASGDTARQKRYVAKHLTNPKMIIASSRKLRDAGGGFETREAAESPHPIAQRRVSLVANAAVP